MKKMPAPSPYTYAENPRSRCICAAAKPTFTRSMKAAKYNNPRNATRRVRTLRRAVTAGGCDRAALRLRDQNIGARCPTAPQPGDAEAPAAAGGATDQTLAAATASISGTKSASAGV